ncbi:MAG TPA: periplasmic heavy metal sensor [Myxococcales bacterium]|nr:periplasmic heavy metal sensor [Myxococcales bacterium]
MGIGTVVLVSVLTFFVLGGLRRLAWMRYGRRGGWRHGHGRRRMGGWFLERFLDEVGASEEQKGKVRGIRQRLFEGMGSLRSARRELVDRALDGLAQEQLATAELDSAVDAVIGKARAEVRQAFVDLHAALTPDQRRRAVELARRRLAHFQA